MATYNTFLEAQAAYNEIAELIAALDTLGKAASFEDINIKLVTAERNLLTIGTVDADFTAFVDAVTTRLTSELATKESDFASNYPCLVDE